MLLDPERRRSIPGAATFSHSKISEWETPAAAATLVRVAGGLLGLPPLLQRHGWFHGRYFCDRNGRASSLLCREGFAAPGYAGFRGVNEVSPHEQNEQVRALMRKILADEFGGVVTHAAKALGISHSIIHEMLAGSRGAGTKVLRALSTHTGRSIDDILHGIGKRLGYHLNEGGLVALHAAFVHLAVRAGATTWYRRGSSARFHRKS